MASDKRIEKLKTILQNRQLDLKVILEDIHDPHNVNAIYRSCEAVGVMDVILIYIKEEFPDIKFKSSASACSTCNTLYGKCSLRSSRIPFKTLNIAFQSNLNHHVLFFYQSYNKDINLYANSVYHHNK